MNWVFAVPYGLGWNDVFILGSARMNALNPYDILELDPDLEPLPGLVRGQGRSSCRRNAVACGGGGELPEGHIVEVIGRHEWFAGLVGGKGMRRYGRGLSNTGKTSSPCSTFKVFNDSLDGLSRRLSRISTLRGARSEMTSG